MGLKLMNCHIEEEILLLCKGRGWNYRQVFLAGIEHLNGMPNILNRMNELELGNAKLSKAYSILWNEIEEGKRNVLAEKGN